MSSIPLFANLSFKNSLEILKPGNLKNIDMTLALRTPTLMILTLRPCVAAVPISLIHLSSTLSDSGRDSGFLNLVLQPFGVPSLRFVRI